MISLDLWWVLPTIFFVFFLVALIRALFADAHHLELHGDEEDPDE